MSLADLLGRLPDNHVGAISAEDLRYVVTELWTLADAGGAVPTGTYASDTAFQTALTRLSTAESNITLLQTDVAAAAATAAAALTAAGDAVTDAASAQTLAGSAAADATAALTAAGDASTTATAAAADAATALGRLDDVEAVLPVSGGAVHDDLLNTETNNQTDPGGQQFLHRTASAYTGDVTRVRINLNGTNGNASFDVRVFVAEKPGGVVTVKAVGDIVTVPLTGAGLHVVDLVNPVPVTAGQFIGLATTPGPGISWHTSPSGAVGDDWDYAYGLGSAAVTLAVDDTLTLGVGIDDDAVGVAFTVTEPSGDLAPVAPAATVAGITAARALDSARLVVQEPVPNVMGPILSMRLPQVPFGPVNIVFCGSSTTEGAGVTNPKNRYVARLLKAFQAAAPTASGTEAALVSNNNGVWGTISTTAGVHGYNMGHGGTRADNYITPTEAQAIADLDPALVTHMIGANDLQAGTVPSTFKANLKAAIQSVEALLTLPCEQVIVSTFARQDVASPAYPWSEYVAAMREAADELGLMFIDVNALAEAVDIAGADPLGMRNADNVHFTDAGHLAVSWVIARALGLPGNAPEVLEVYAEDAFNRANEANFSGSVADSGQTWITNDATLQLLNNAVTTSANGGYRRAMLNDGQVEGAWRVRCVNGKNLAHGLFFNGDAAGNGYQWLWSGSASAWRFGRITSGFSTTAILLVDAAGAPAISTGQTYTLTVERSGNTFYLYVDDVLVGTATDTTYAGTYHGVLLYGDEAGGGYALDDWSHKSA